MTTDLPSRAAIEAAYERIRPHIRSTPILEIPGKVLGVAPTIVLKLEHTQIAGSFKARGAFNALLASPPPPAGIAAASGGNHGIAAATAAASLGMRAEIFVPSISAPAKQAKLRATGATLHVGGRDFAEAREACDAHAATTGARIVHAYDDPDVVAGQGTLALEFEQQAGPLDALLIAIGGGGLIGGVASWHRGATSVFGVESEGTGSMRASLDAGKIVDFAVSGLAADALGARRVGSIGFAAVQTHVREVVLVSDDALRDAQLRLWDALRLAVEPSGAAGLAALLTGKVAFPASARIGLVLCGGNLDPATLAAEK
ncbi:serine/threonine dehydratase [Roseiterribacter gracilis]|uniref:Threonine dehydratase n=1 Tax=Roseiterribacter gracilis TaxID=2812848 RepID=A0A8S8XFI8_9PROT|nr:threonine dehydratase [Rhodospirillales bacterium TMPK1]